MDRYERDALGEVKLSKDVFWGTQTERAVANFKVGTEKVPLDTIYALVSIKKVVAQVNSSLGVLDPKIAALIVDSCNAILDGGYDDNFPVSIWQTGSGTQSNMNVNEVIANIANVKAGSKLGARSPVHPNDHVNLAQSTNDVFPSAVHICAYKATTNRLLPVLRSFHEELLNCKKKFSAIVKTGRTHLMDACPILLGEEFGGYARQLQNAIDVIEHALTYIAEIPLGATAVGSGINSHPDYIKEVIPKLAEELKLPLVAAKNPYEALSSKDAILQLSSALRRLSAFLFKFIKDIRFYASGPRAGIGEIILPVNEPGSSIMPGKVNPTQCESVLMVLTEVFGNDHAIAFAAMQGECQLNVFMPVILYNILKSINLLADVIHNFQEKCLLGITPNEKKIKFNLERNLMLATVLNRHVGYDKASAIVKNAVEKELTLKESALELKALSADEFDALVDIHAMLKPNLS